MIIIKTISLHFLGGCHRTSRGSVSLILNKILKKSKPVAKLLIFTDFHLSLVRIGCLSCSF